MAKAKLKELSPEIGRVLVSQPFLLDSYFKRSVILLGEHGDDGTVGFILNKPTDLKVNDALDDFPEIDAQLYFGGPVQTDTIHFMHNLGGLLDGSKVIMPGVCWGGDLEMLKMLIDTGKASPDNLRFYAGYTGWDPFQLADELKEQTWFVTQGNKKFVLAENPESLWGDVLKGMGSVYAVLANFPEDPSLN